jgi:transcriptional regulator with XRE-family HTH domain
MMTMTEDEHVSAPQPYGLVLAGNVAAARIRLRISQESLAERMRALGLGNWRKQTVSELEAGRRAIRADELLPLSIGLDTTAAVLTTLPVGMTAAALPNGQPVGAYRVITPDQTFAWDGNRLKVAPSTRPDPPIDALIAERRREGRALEAAALEAYRDRLHETLPEEPQEEDQQESGAEDIPVRRPGKRSR